MSGQVVLSVSLLVRGHGDDPKPMTPSSAKRASSDSTRNEPSNPYASPMVCLSCARIIKPTGGSPVLEQFRRLKRDHERPARPWRGARCGAFGRLIDASQGCPWVLSKFMTRLGARKTSVAESDRYPHHPAVPRSTPRPGRCGRTTRPVGARHDRFRCQTFSGEEPLGILAAGSADSIVKSSSFGCIGKRRSRRMVSEEDSRSMTIGVSSRPAPSSSTPESGGQDHRVRGLPIDGRKENSDRADWRPHAVLTRRQEVGETRPIVVAQDHPGGGIIAGRPATGARGSGRTAGAPSPRSSRRRSSARPTRAP